MSIIRVQKILCEKAIYEDKITKIHALIINETKLTLNSDKALIFERGKFFRSCEKSEGKLKEKSMKMNVNSLISKKLDVRT